MATGPPPPDVNIGPAVLHVVWTLEAIAILILFVRILTSTLVLRKVSVSDYLMILAVILNLISTAMDTVAEQHGLGRHVIYLTPTQIAQTMKWQTISSPFAILSPLCGRISFAFYMLKLVGASKTKAVILWFIIWISVITNIMFVILLFGRCKNINSLWDIQAPGKCWPYTVEAVYGLFLGVVNTIIDLALTILPAIVVYSLQLKPRVKAGLTLLLSLSIFAAVSSCIKTYYLKSFHGDDITYEIATFLIWFTLENTIVIAAASIPSIRPLFVRSPEDWGSSGYQMHSQNLDRAEGPSGAAGSRSGVRSRAMSKAGIAGDLGPGSGADRRASKMTLSPPRSQWAGLEDDEEKEVGSVALTGLRMTLQGERGKASLIVVTEETLEGTSSRTDSEVELTIPTRKGR